MVLNEESGGYALGQVVRLIGSFRINGTSNPDGLRTGGSSSFTVTRTSAGLFRVQFATGADRFPIPERPVFMDAHLHQVANPTVWSRAHVVRDSWDQANRRFDIQVLKATATADTADSPSDADDNDVVSFEVVGSISSSGTDPS